VGKRKHTREVEWRGWVEEGRVGRRGWREEGRVEVEWRSEVELVAG